MSEISPTVQKIWPPWLPMTIKATPSIDYSLSSSLRPQPIRGVFSLFIRILISGPFNSTLPEVNNKGLSAAPVKPIPISPNFARQRIFRFIFSFIGLQISYVLWGLLQERMMTRRYDDEKFTNSQFLVFANRLLAVMVAFISMKVFYPVAHPTPTGPPLYQYGIVSYANCMSTWFQYESLLYISFPVQVIAKSVKTIPVMILGKFVSGKTYPLRQYLLMLLMAVGIALFLSGYSENHTVTISSKRAKQNITTSNGLVLLIFYLVSLLFENDLRKLDEITYIPAIQQTHAHRFKFLSKISHQHFLKT
ncbi:unnamed protein product [Rotaria magnacalcarata]|uniref:Adenosine 3'-phospho 5'-phosphosulfate transporter 1 n=1 Tax=Rotaria magnacalcarata TaxID=392030 RepID=A0A8S3CM52_9BILA|nr:unnamed protein product [Rotaria magnacalcarata]